MATARLARLLVPALAVAILGAVAVAHWAGSSGSEASHFDADIEHLQAALANVTDPGERAQLSEKLANAEADRANELAGRKPQAGDARKEAFDGLEGDQTLTLAATTAVVGGAISDAARPIDFSRDFVSANAWVRELGNQQVLIVYAGRSVSNDEPSVAPPELGMVKVYRQGYYGSSVESLGAFKPRQPVKGDLRVIDGNGDLLTLVANDGTRLTFDVGALRFVE